MTAIQTLENKDNQMKVKMEEMIRKVIKLLVGEK